MRLLSYNIHKGIGGRDRRYRLDRILAAIEAENPDVICLQEVDRKVRRSRYHNQPHLFAEYFNSQHHLYQLNVPLSVGGYGNFLLSRWPIVTHHHVSLRFNSKKPRGAQLAVIESPEGKVHVINWHLGLSEQERQWQVQHLLAHHLFQESAQYPTLIAGDFNDWRNTLANRVFDAHEFHQVTTPASRFRSFPAYMAVGSLDKAFFRGEMHIHQVRVVRNALTRQASDHLPLVVDFHLRPPEDCLAAVTPDDVKEEEKKPHHGGAEETETTVK